MEFINFVQATYHAIFTDVLVRSKEGKSIVASKRFINDNPAAKRLFEIFHMSVADISTQNARMMDGEKNVDDIDRHVDKWITANQKTWNNWLEEARNATS